MKFVNYFFNFTCYLPYFISFNIFAIYLLKHKIFKNYFLIIVSFHGQKQTGNFWLRCIMQVHEIMPFCRWVRQILKPLFGILFHERQAGRLQIFLARLFWIDLLPARPTIQHKPPRHDAQVKISLPVPDNPPRTAFFTTFVLNPLEWSFPLQKETTID